MQLLMSRVVRRAQPTDESASGLLEEDHKRRKDSTIRGFRESFSAVVFGSWLNVLLLLAPLSLRFGVFVLQACLIPGTLGVLSQAL